MRTKTLLFLLIGLTSHFLVEAQHNFEKTVFIRAENEPLKQILHSLEKQASVKFLYTNQIISRQKITLHKENIPLSHLLDTLLKPLAIDYQVMENGFIRLTKSKTTVPVSGGLAAGSPGKNQSSDPKFISGSITDASTNEGIPGVNVLIKGTLEGKVTDADGKFSILVDTASILLFSYVGYLSQSIKVGRQTHLQIALSADNRQLDEVVVTALGVEREKREVGYAMQMVAGEDISKAQEMNLVNTLAGKIAGVTVVNNPSSIGGSSRITIRGERSLNIGKNQPLFVVDGVPITNELIGSSGRNNQEVDYGNGAGLVNPDDIESITVLKGANATALYGSRGQNGVVLIKSKTGRRSKGMGVILSSTFTLENPLRLPEYQNVYGQGINGIFEFREDLGSISWGPEMNGQLVKQFDSPTTNGFRGGDVGNLHAQIGDIDISAQLAERGEIMPTSFLSHSANVKDFFQTGITTSQHVAVSGSNDKAHIRLAYTYANQRGIIPNTDLKRHAVTLNTGYKIGSRLNLSLSANYSKSLSNNRPSLTYGNENLMFYFIWMGRSVNMRSLREYWQYGKTGVNQFNSSYGAHDNPYFTVYENTNGQDLNRLLGNISATYRFSSWLQLMLRAGTDYVDEFRNRKRAYSSQKFPKGSYREEEILLQETNVDFLLSANKAISSDISLSASVGGNALYRKIKLSDTSVPQLAIPGEYSLMNANVPLEYASFHSEKKIHSLYAFTQLGYKDLLYLELTGRNDWSSALPAHNWSYFYPSVSVSAIVSDIFSLSPHINFAKVRAGIAGVGNDTDPYQLASVYGPQTPVQGTPTYTEFNFIPNAQLKPEQSRSVETGFEMKLFQNRLAVDVSLYHTLSKNQILSARVSNTTGYRTRIINAGKIENKGLEAILTFIPIQLKNGFTWTTGINFSLNRSKVRELYTDPVTGQKIESHVISTRYVNIQASVGDRMGDIYGIGYQRVSANPNDPYYDPSGKYVGQIVYNEKGAPLATPNLIKLGNYNPDWLAGWQHTFSWKNLSLMVLLDIRKGGKLYSHTQTIGREAGSLIETLEGRTNGYDLNLPGNGVVGKGVVALTDAEGNITGFLPNTIKLPAQEWHTALTANRRILEPMMYDASFVKLREMKVSYTFSKRLLPSSFLQELTFSLVGRNLFLWSKVPHIDPETASTAGGTIIPGVDSLALPTVRSYGFTLSVKL
ncbi:SusC/RagA family TonB-linked outer membrane protein [Rhodocytophaga rosea]|uniref:SusC/RagA family TonB-linked outer membrane protein n=1 Tax=Rhodocytophaga rosea TaxID=2704465 RepID=A0A6C0GLV7_9BACT|nr:SusC/RagA family TonB-linked outer membrane protein [Rhodocytophaga rosea]QHT68794.1 SusC/RagA family TonB-linked outer membrane protein [Rhodocytophaga rosea]